MSRGGGRRIPDIVRTRTEQRVRRYAEEHYAGHYTRLDIRFRGHFCYFDACTEPTLIPGWPREDGPETREAYVERLRSTPTYLGRLEYIGNEHHWAYAFYAYSSESYQPSMFPNGSFTGTPEEAFELSAAVYL